VNRYWLRVALVVVAIALGVVTWTQQSRTTDGTDVGAPASAPRSGDTRSSDESDRSALPPEAIATLAAIEAGGPFRYARDGTEFMNRERQLPSRPRGYYREYTVETPGASDRGARRIVAGGDPPEVYYYTDDHYRTFRRVEARHGR